MLRVAVGLRVDGDRLDAELVERADDADGDLAAVGDQDLCEHQRRAMLSARLVLVRHGESTWNAEARLQGQPDPPLSERGRAEAAALAPVVAVRRRSASSASDLGRARETAELIGLAGAARRALAGDRRRRVGAAGPPPRSTPSGRSTDWRGGPRTRPDGEPWEEFAGARRRRRSTS